MKSLYNKHGLVFWDEREILKREQLVQELRSEMRTLLQDINRAWVIVLL